MSTTITPLTGSTGAEVAGLRLGAPLDAPTFAELERAFLAHGVLVFRDQHLTPAQQLAFARLWGEPVVTPMLKALDGYPEVVQIADMQKERATTENWHYDAPFTAAPPKISILCALTVPRGGDTMWSNQALAYERLSEGMKRMIAGLKVEFAGTRIGRFMGVDPKDIPPPRAHPLVRTHPQSGRKALYVGHPETAVRIEGMTDAESRPLLDYLYEVSVLPDNVYRHMWRAGDVVMWDNRCTMHYAVHDYGDARRVLNRVTLKGEVPA
ncbi:MAG: TauD/TfdA family dioxygenase [Burkholderiales bacterium]|nr:TauD/TfdA family dioxygenase [Burkholderiales bacterium]